MTRCVRTVFFSFLLILCSIPAFSQRLGFSGYGDMAIDFPVGFQLMESSNDGSSYELKSTVLPVTCIIKIYHTSRYASPKDALDSSLKALKAENETEEFEWRNQTSAISSFNTTLNRQRIMGYGLSASLPEGKGTVVMLAWAGVNQFQLSETYILSFLDSLIIDEGCYFETGPITRYLYPKTENRVDVNLEIDGKKIATSLAENDREAADYLIAREYDILKLYMTNANWKKAWQRYYRMIFKDSYNRLWRVAFDVYNELAPSAADETDLAQKILTWTQGFKYERESSTSDFTSLPAVLLGEGNDCDSRSMLIAIFLTSWNQDAIMLVSAELSHAMPAFTSDHPGHSFTYDGKKYLMGETTAKGQTWGKIDATQDDQRKWLEVMFP